MGQGGKLGSTGSASALKPKLLAVSVAACFAATAPTASALPTGGVGVLNVQSILSSGNTMTIATSGARSIANFNSFSIGINELVKIQQDGAASRFLGRVVVVDPNNVSNILGGLQSNGQVFLLNPNGIVFGAGAKIDVAGLVASSLSLSDQDFVNGRMRFTATPGAGAVINNAGSDPNVEG